MKKLIILIACALTASMHAMKLDNQVIPLDKKTQINTISTYEDFEKFFETKPDINTTVKFEFSQLTSRERTAIFQEASGQYQALELLTGAVVFSGLQVRQFNVSPEVIQYLKMLKEVRDCLASQLSTE